jgi:hypothetical protein
MAMLVGKLVLLAALTAQVADMSHDPTTLVGDLGSSRYASREAAAQALERLGRPALGALRNARDSNDPEVRTRAAALAQKIESALLTQPTRVRLNYENALLPEIMKSLSAQCGFRIELYPAHMPRWTQQRLTAKDAGAVEFWKAIDRVCDLAGLQYNARLHGSVGQSEPIFSLTDGMSRTITPVSDHGPFRVSLQGVDYQRHLVYAPSGGGAVVPPPPRPVGVEPAPARADNKPGLNPITSVQFSTQLLVAAEPRLILSHVRPVKLVEAVDELGNSLLPVPEAIAPQNRYAGYLGTTNGPVVQIQAQLRKPDPAGRRIKRLVGLISLTVSSRRPDPLVIPLNNSVGKTFDNRECRLTVHDIRATPTNHNLALELSIRPNDPDDSADHATSEMIDDGFQRADPQHLQIEVTDAGGRLIPWFQSGADAESSRFTLTLTNQSQPSHLKELRYYGLTRAAVQIPFEFADIPMP